MTETELKIFRLKDNIRILNWHLEYEKNPDKYSLVKTPEKRQADIAYIMQLISEKEEKLKEFENQ